MDALKPLWGKLQGMDLSQVLIPELMIPLLIVANALYLSISSKRHGLIDGRVLKGLSLLLILPLIYQFSGLQNLVEIQSRNMMESLGWYDHRRPVQLGSMLLFLFAASGFTLQQTKNLSPQIRFRFTWALWGGFGFWMVSLFQSISYHDVDTIFNQSMANWHFQSIAKIFTLAMISVSILADIYSTSIKRRALPLRAIK